MIPTQSDFARTERGWRNANETYLHAMIHAYFDDSADGAGNYVACGGVLGEAFSMTVIETMWADATKHLAEPFHSTDCESQREQFKAWSVESCRELMSSLVGILCHPKIHVGAVGSVINVPYFQEVFPDTSAKDAYRVAVKHTIVTMARVARKHNEKVKLWFESGPTNGITLDAYTTLSQHATWAWEERHRLAGISFNDKSLIPLQAADIIAREAMKAALNHGIRPIRIPVKRIWNHAGILVLGKESLQELRDLGGHDSLDAITRLSDKHYVHERNTDEVSRDE